MCNVALFGLVIPITIMMVIGHIIGRTSVLADAVEKLSEPWTAEFIAAANRGPIDNAELSCLKQIRGKHALALRHGSSINCISNL